MSTAKTETIRLTATVPATPAQIYRAWLSSKGHAALTGAGARVVGRVGGKFTAWDGYISGRTIELEKDRRIVQRWRTTDFAASAPDSRLEVLLAPAKSGTRITLVHSQIPKGGGRGYKKGWVDYYFAPMKALFTAKR